jgi:hypothetical protein
MANTTNLGIGKVDSNTKQPEVPVNSAFDYYDAVLAGRLIKSVAGSANVTLTNDEARNARIELTGLLTANIVVFIPVPGGSPAGFAARRFTLLNSTTGAFTVTIKTTASGSAGVVVPQNALALLDHDGTNVFAISLTNPLNIGLVAYYKLEEASGIRYDAKGNNHLSATNTPGSAAGKIGNALSTVAASSQYLSIASNSNFAMSSTDFTVACWVYLNSKPAVEGICGKYGASPNEEYWVSYESAADRFKFKVSKDGTTGNRITIQADNFGSPSTATWYFIVCWFDSAAGLINISINNGTPNSAACATAFAATNNFNIGQEGAGSYFDGRIDSLGVWKRVLTATEKTNLYNGGTGLDYPF